MGLFGSNCNCCKYSIVGRGAVDGVCAICIDKKLKMAKGQMITGEDIVYEISPIIDQYRDNKISELDVADQIVEIINSKLENGGLKT